MVALRRGFAVTVYSPIPPLATTSARAAASFKPSEVAVNRLARRTLEQSWEGFARIAADEPTADTGVRLHTHWEAASRELARPWYADVVRGIEEHRRPDVPGGYAFGRSYTTFFVDMPVYLGWLEGQIRAAAGVFVVLAGPLASFADLEALPADVVVNCTGMGARALVGDAAVVPVKGQVVLVGPRPAMDWSISADGFYVYPRRDMTVLGSTAERGVDDEIVDRATTQLILRANRRILPELELSDVIGTAAGLRPYREGSMRIERDPDSPRLIHNYGHGGAGVTLSWGSAEAAVALI
jgi:D-amino-acid oxidase